MRVKEKVLLTGASGTVGQAVLKELCSVKNKYDVTVFDVKTSKTTRKLKPFRDDINIVYGDITNESDLIKVSHNKDIVIHLAAITPPLTDDKRALSYKINVEATEKLIRLLELHSPNAFFLYSSSISVYGDRLNNPLISIDDKLDPSEDDEYAKTKLLAEDIIQNCKLDWAIFRLTAIMGEYKTSKLMFHQPLKSPMEIASLEDTARAFVNAIDKQVHLSNEIFNLGGGENCRIMYDDFLSHSFKIQGLGELDFPSKTFAEKNLYCGYYEDGYVLNNILNFRNDTLEEYFETQKRSVSFLKKLTISIFRKPIKKYLQSQSEPLAAYVNETKSTEYHLKSNNKKQVE